MIIRKLQPSDYKVLADLASNKRIWNNLRDAMPHPYTEEEARQFIASKKDQTEDYVFVIDVDEVFCGIIGLHPQKDIYRISCELGYWIGEEYWGRAYATTAVGMVLDLAFNKYKFLRVFAGVLAHNEASRRVLEKNGFKLEGIARKAVIKNGKVLDEWRYAITDDDFFTVSGQ